LLHINNEESDKFGVRSLYDLFFFAAHQGAAFLIFTRNYIRLSYKSISFRNQFSI